MTKQFDTLLESMLAEMVPASMMDDFGPGEMSAAVKKKVEELPGKSQHWGPLQKLDDSEREKVIKAIIDNVFTEKGNTYTPLADNKEELKALIKNAIVKTTKDYPEFKAGGKWAVQFLADRLANEELLGKVKYTTEGGEEIKKDVTQKEIKAALNKALQSSPTEQSVWKKSSEPEKMSIPEPSSDEEPTEVKKKTESVFFKAKDASFEDEELHKAYKALPDKDLSWEGVIEAMKKAGFKKPTTIALNLLDAGGLMEEEKEKESNEEEDVPALDELDDEEADLSNFDRAARMIDPSYRDTRGSFDKFSSGEY